MYHHLNNTQDELIKRAVGRWITDLEENQIYSAEDEALASEAIYLIRAQLQEIYDEFDNDEEDS